MPSAPGTTLGELSERFDITLASSDAGTVIEGVCGLRPGRAGHVTFAESQVHSDALANTQATAVVLPAALAPRCRVGTLIAAQPRLAFARIAALFEPSPPRAGTHSAAVVEDGARVDPRASIGAHSVIAAGCVIEAGAVIAPGCVIGPDTRIGDDTIIGSNSSIGRGVLVGQRVRIEPNAVIGARGFGLVHNGQGWEPVPQMGRVSIGDDAEIGAGTTIDRGALDDTVIGTGVKIDDQVHIGHNCVIGVHTVIAGCTGIAGSCDIGSNCMIGGGVGIGDHVRIADGVIITAASQVPKNIDVAGIYSSTFRAMPAAGWRKRLALFRQLDRIECRLKKVEQADSSRGEPQ